MQDSKKIIETSVFNKIDDEIRDAFHQIEMPRTEVQLRQFVVGSHDTPEMQYLQCVLEMRVLYDNLRIRAIDMEILEIELNALKKQPGRIPTLEAKKKNIEMERMSRRMVGGVREFQVLYAIWNEFDKKYTREDIDKTQVHYWQERLNRQASQDKAASGRIGAGNIEAMLQLKRSVAGKSIGLSDGLS